MGKFKYNCKKNLRSIELSLLKYALGVKQSTPNDLGCHELCRGDVVSKLEDRQAKFIKKIKNLTEEDAVVKCIWNKAQHLKVSDYYNSLKRNNYEVNKENRINKLDQSSRSMDLRYKELVGLKNVNCLYD